MLRKVFFAVIAGTVLLSGTSMVVAQSGDPIKERQAIMKSNGAAMKKFTAVAKGEAALDDEVKQLANQMHEHATSLATLFPAGTAAGSKAKETIWSDSATFAQALQQFQDRTAQLVQVAQAGDTQAFGAQLAEVGASCGACHKAFRN